MSWRTRIGTGKRSPVVSLHGYGERVVPSAGDLSEAVALQMAVRQAWAALEEAQQTLLEMKAEGKGNGEIAAHLDLKPEQAKKRLQRAQAHFQKHLADGGCEELFTQKRVASRSRQFAPPCA